MSWILISVCTFMIFLISLTSEIRIKKKEDKIKSLTSLVNGYEIREEKIKEKFSDYNHAVDDLQESYLELNDYCKLLIFILEEQFGEEKADELISEVVERGILWEMLEKEFEEGEEKSNDEEWWYWISSR